MEAGMKLIQRPLVPRPDSFYVPYQYLRTHSEWQKFLVAAG